MGEVGFGGRVVVSFESRRAAEMASLVERHGGGPVSAPTLREVTIVENARALAFAHDLRDGAFDVVVLMTGVGTRALVEEIAPSSSAARSRRRSGGSRWSSRAGPSRRRCCAS